MDEQLIKKKISKYMRLIKEAQKRKNKDFIDCCLAESYVSSLNKYIRMLNDFKTVKQ